MGHVLSSLDIKYNIQKSLHDNTTTIINYGIPRE